MVEAAPSFEDDRIRTWTFGPGERALQGFDDDPTLMYVDVEREEVFESRTYRFRESPEVFAFLVQMAAAQLTQAGAPAEAILPFARELMLDTTYKFLAKRNKVTGTITATLVAVGGGERSLLFSQGDVGEDEYRRAVEGFEKSYLPEGVLAQPLVVTLEEWRQYSDNGPFSGKESDPAG